MVGRRDALRARNLYLCAGFFHPNKTINNIIDNDDDVDDDDDDDDDDDNNEMPQSDLVHDEWGEPPGGAGGDGVGAVRGPPGRP